MKRTPPWGASFAWRDDMQATRNQERENNGFARVLFAALVALVTAVCPANAQKPERRQEVRVPGIGLNLKAGWQLVFHDGCRFAVPSTWRATADGTTVSSPDGSRVSVGMFKITNWSAHKGQMKAAYGRVNVLHEESDRRLWFEFGDAPRVHHVVDVANGLSVCIGVLDFSAATTLNAEDVNRIAGSVGLAPAQWPHGEK